MGKEKYLYRAKKPESRRGFFYNLLYDAAAYTPRERRLREKILILREYSGLDQSLLQTDIAWFQGSDAQAFEIQNENAWFLETMLKPRSVISHDSFHVFLSEQKQVWPALSVLRRKVADFLLQRSSLYPDAQLNDPIHYFYLDLMQILQRLAQSGDAEFVAAQLPRLSQYLQQSSGLIENKETSDKLFINDCRIHIRTVLNEDIAKVIDSQQFSTILSQLQSALEMLGEGYHTVLHFSLVATPVNDHPYWELFEQQNQAPSEKHFPTLTARQCLQSNALTVSPLSGLHSIALPDCPGMMFHPEATEEHKNAYLHNLQQLEELLHLKHMLLRVQILTEQAGELFTIFTFRQDLIALFDQIDQFFLKSHQNILQLININEDLYHQSIIQSREASWWVRWATNQKQQLGDFIHNQDNFARFNINAQSLEQRLHKVTELLIRANTQMRSQQHILQQQQRVLDVPKEIQALLGAMYAWRLEQNEKIGLPMPEKPRILADKTDRPNGVSTRSLPEDLPEANEVSDDMVDLSHEEVPSQSCTTDPAFINAANQRVLFFGERHVSGLAAPQVPSQISGGQANTPAMGNGMMMLAAVAPAVLLLLLIYVMFRRNRAEENKEEEIEPAGEGVDNSESVLHSGKYRRTL